MLGLYDNGLHDLILLNWDTLIVLIFLPIEQPIFFRGRFCKQLRC